MSEVEFWRLVAGCTTTGLVSVALMMLRQDFWGSRTVAEFVRLVETTKDELRAADAALELRLMGRIAKVEADFLRDVAEMKEDLREIRNLLTAGR